MAAKWDIITKMQVDQASIFNSSVAVIATGGVFPLWASTSAVTPHLLLNANNYVGLGSTGPGVRLSVSATGSAATDYAQIWRNASGTIVSSMSATGVLTPKAACTQTVGYPSHAVIFTVSTGCPAGWTDHTGSGGAVAGRFLVGLPSGGTLTGTKGTALSNLEDRPIGQHKHPISDPGHTHTVDVFDADQCCFYAGSGTYDMDTGGNTGTSGTGIANTDYYGASGTNVPFIQVRICEKN